MIWRDVSMPMLIESIEKSRVLPLQLGGGRVEGEDNLNKFTTTEYY
jgi:hypothetical protein